MTIVFSDTIRNAVLDSIVDLCDAGSPPGNQVG